MPLTGAIAMTATLIPQILTFEQYLAYEDDTDKRYELERGVLVEMGQARGQHGEIMHFLENQFSAEIVRLGWEWVARQAAIGVRIPQVGKRDTSRCPDVCIIPRNQWESLLNKEAIIELDETPPLLVVEVISKGTFGRDRRTKRTEYNIIGIPVYIIVNFLTQDGNGKDVEPGVSVLNLVEDLYDEVFYQGDRLVEIPTFPELKLTANQILKAKI
jgi:Uma2 family endonuclease